MVQGFSPVRGIRQAETPFAILYEGFPYNEYEIKKGIFTPEEERLAQALSGALNRSLHSDEWTARLPTSIPKGFAGAFKTRIMSYADSSEIVDKLPLEEDWEKVTQLMNDLLTEYQISLTDKERFIEHVLDDGVGFGYLGLRCRE